MKLYLIPQEGNFYKANLHAHSTVSDGLWSPKHLKEFYKANGYSILALTDHELLVDHSALDDKDFLMITGMEYAFIEKDNYNESRTIELNLFAKDQHNTTQVCFNPKYVIHGKDNAKNVKSVGAPFEREYTLDCIQEVIDEANENGFLVSLNHPCYSMETPEFFGNLNGLFAMEIYNHISFVVSGVFDYNQAMYTDMLRRGKRLFCLATDDCHGGALDNEIECDRYGGFVMIKAKELVYGEVVRALEQGDFYSSCGPLIQELYVEDDKLYIKTSPVKSIALNTERRPFGGIRLAKKNEYLTEAVFDLPKGQKFFLFDIIDEQGRHANTRAYFLDTLGL